MGGSVPFCLIKDNAALCLECTQKFATFQLAYLIGNTW